MKRIITLLLLLSFYTVITNAKTPSKVEKGKATYYAKKFNNRKTASGAIYKSDMFVCAHRKHPFGTKLRIKNLKNSKEVVVEVIDRGPFTKGRIVDISYAAAKKLDMIHHGVTMVEVSIYTESDSTRLLDTAYLLETDSILKLVTKQQ